MFIEPYLFFEGRCEEAMEYYKSALGAEITALMRYNESPEPEMIPPGSEDKVMHGNLRIGDTTVMMSDGSCSGTSDFKGFSLSLAVSNESDANRMFAALADGGEVQMPLGKTFWSPCFGMAMDRFGVSWMLSAESTEDK